MKKSNACVALAFLMIAATLTISCGTSDSEKMACQNNAQNTLKESFGEAAIQAPIPNVKTIQLIDSVFIPPLQTLNVKKCFSTDKKEAIANFYHWGNYNDWLYEKSGQVENLPGFMLYIYQTIKNTTDREILGQTGGALLSEAELAQAWAYLIAKQPNAEYGKLITNGYANISHVKLNDGAAVAVGAYWPSAGDEWGLRAHELDSWYDGCLVFSRGKPL
jgi:hypothetical protein